LLTYTIYVSGRGAGNNSSNFTDEQLNRPAELQGANSTQNLNMTLQQEGTSSTHDHSSFEQQGSNITQDHLNMTLQQQSANSTQDNLDMTLQQQSANRTQDNLDMTLQQHSANSTQENLNTTLEEQGANSTQDNLNMTLEEQGANSTQENIKKERPYGVKSIMHVSNLGYKDIEIDIPSAKPNIKADRAGMWEADHTNRSYVTVVKDLARNHGFFKAPYIDPFAKQVNGSHYTYLLLRVLEGIDSKWNSLAHMKLDG
jgi:hypothetical protein